jgi:hypothetical protein
MSHVDHDAQPVHLAYELTAGSAQATVQRGLGLQIAVVVLAVVHDGDRPDPGRVRVTDTVKIPLCEVGALACDEERSATLPMSRQDIVGAPDQTQAVASADRLEGAELALVVGDGFTILEVPNRAKAAVRSSPEHT